VSVPVLTHRCGILLVDVCVCVRERERERESVCVCFCACAYTPLWHSARRCVCVCVCVFVWRREEIASQEWNLEIGRWGVSKVADVALSPPRLASLDRERDLEVCVCV